MASLGDARRCRAVSVASNGKQLNVDRPKDRQCPVGKTLIEGSCGYIKKTLLGSIIYIQLHVVKFNTKLQIPLSSPCKRCKHALRPKRSVGNFKLFTAMQTHHRILLELLERSLLDHAAMFHHNETITHLHRF